MLTALAVRCASLLITLAIISLAIFVILEVLPGDPAAIMLGTSSQPDTLAALRTRMGLDQPALIRYLAWIGGIFTGNFGISYSYGVPVAELIRIFVGTWDLVGAAIGLQGPAVGRAWWDLTFRSELPYYYIFLAVLAVVLYTTFEVERSRFGYYLRAIKAGERAARHGDRRLEEAGRSAHGDLGTAKAAGHVDRLP